jgi:3-oxoadipate enol-lactonase
LYLELSGAANRYPFQGQEVYTLVAMFAEINGIRLGYEDQGQGLPVVFVHAFPLNRTMWEPQARALSQHCRTITVDLRGHGESEAPIWHFPLDQFADDLAALFDHLALSSVVLVGLSMGGYILFAFYRRHPAYVKAMVLADTRAQADTDEGRANRYQLAQAAYRQGAGAVADAMMPKLVSPSALRDRPDLIRRIRTIIESTQISGIVVDLMAMAARADSRDLLSTINVPALVIVGGQDVATPPADAQIIADGIRHSKLVVIPEAGHLANLEAPTPFNQALMNFLKTVR